MLPAPFKLRGRNFDHETRCAGPALQVRDSQDPNSVCEVVGCIGKSNLKFGNPATHGKVFGYQVGVPIGYLAEAATSVSKQLSRGQTATFGDRKPLEEWTANSDPSQLRLLSPEEKQAVAQWASFFPALCKERLEDALPADPTTWLYETIQTIRSKYPPYRYEVPTAVQVLLLQAREELGTLFELDADQAAFDAIITDEARSQAARLASQAARPFPKQKSVSSTAHSCTSDISSIESHGSSHFQRLPVPAAAAHEFPAIRRMSRVSRSLRQPGLHANTVTSSQDSGPAIARPCSRAADASSPSPWFQMVQLPMLKVPEVFPADGDSYPASPVHGNDDQRVGRSELEVLQHGSKRQKMLQLPTEVVPEPGSKTSMSGTFMRLLQEPLDISFTFVPVNSKQIVGSAKAPLAPSRSLTQFSEPASPPSRASSDGYPMPIRPGCMDAPGFPPQPPCSSPATLAFDPPINAAELPMDCSFDADIAAMMQTPTIDGFILPEAAADIAQGAMPFHHEPDSQARSVTPIRSVTPLCSMTPGCFYAHAAAYTSTVPQVVPGRSSPACNLMLPAAFPVAEPADTADRSETTSTAQAHKHTVTSGIQGRGDRALAYFTQNFGPGIAAAATLAAPPAGGSGAMSSLIAADEALASGMADIAGFGQTGVRSEDQLGRGGKLPIDPLPEADSADFSSFCEAVVF
ncbi:hypothetical protein WJX74_004338 [Apatococcus lobatus]|uniref:Proteophosphoglycan ppg4 n=1 Tax=Apatococcus lobatus TaxID=904363 RepID=A0AAW1R2Q4_9CHLO